MAETICHRCVSVHRGARGESTQADRLWEHQSFNEALCGEAGVGGEFPVVVSPEL